MYINDLHVKLQADLRVRLTCTHNSVLLQLLYGPSYAPFAVNISVVTMCLSLMLSLSTSFPSQIQGNSSPELASLRASLLKAQQYADSITSGQPAAFQCVLSLYSYVAEVEGVLLGDVNAARKAMEAMMQKNAKDVKSWMVSHCVTSTRFCNLERLFVFPASV